jgi:putative Mg2+ transporter-C (MgtC) family protein
MSDSSISEFAQKHGVDCGQFGLLNDIHKSKTLARGDGMESLLLEDVIKLLLAMVLGGVIGAEREFRDKAAGFRTIIFICVGSTLFTILSARLGGNTEPSHIAANIVSGVGFIGAGVILQGRERVVGITTASTIWLAAALGMGIGGGYYLLTGLATFAALVVLFAFRRIEGLSHKTRDIRTYEIHYLPNAMEINELQEMIRESGLKLAEYKKMKSEDIMITVWTVYGSAENHHQLMDRLFSHPSVIEFKV